MGQRQGIRGTLARLFLVFAVLGALAPVSAALAQGTAVFSRVDVAGNQRVEADTVRVFAGIEPGQPVTPEQLNLAVRNLFDTGLFEDVQVMPEAGRLVITVKSKTRRSTRSPSRATTPSTTRNCRRWCNCVRASPTRWPRPRQDAQRIVDAYRAAGRYGAEVNPVIIRRSENRVDLVFEISEGRKTGIQRVNFVGNQHFSDRRLRRVIQTNQSNWFSFLFGNNTYDQPTGSSSTRSCCGASISSAATSTSRSCRRRRSSPVTAAASSCRSPSPRASGSTSARSRSVRRPGSQRRRVPAAARPGG